MASTPIPAVANVDKDGKLIYPENKDNIWIIGGESVFRAGLEIADTIYLTLIPEYIRDISKPVYFPFIDPSQFFLHEDLISLENSQLKVYQYSRL